MLNIFRIPEDAIDLQRLEIFPSIFTIVLCLISIFISFINLNASKIMQLLCKCNALFLLVG